MRSLLALAAVLLLAGEAAALVTTNPTRFEVGEVTPGEGFERVIVVKNRGATPTTVEVAVTTFENEHVEVEPAGFSLAPEEERSVTIRVLLLANASGGRHDVRVTFLEGAAGDGGGATGRSGVLVPVIFAVENLKVGNLQTWDVAEGEDAAARVLAQNFLGVASDVDVVAVVFDESGAEVARGLGRARAVAANASESVNVTLPTSALPPGAYLVRAWAETGAFVAAAWTKPLAIGEQELGVANLTVDPLVGGARVSAEVVNTGAVPLSGVVTFLARDATGRVVRSVDVPAGLLRSGSLSRVETDMDLPPGEYTIEAVVRWGDAASAGSTAPVAVAQQAPPPLLPAWWPAGALAAFGAIGVGWWWVGRPR